MGAAAIIPLLRIREGLTPKKAGCHNTRSAILPTSIDPTESEIPWLRAGFIVYFAIYLLLSDYLIFHRHQLGRLAELSFCGPFAKYVI